MEMEITLPEEVPVMTLQGTALFPQALMPLHIFEPRYRQMLRDVLASNRLFAVAGLDFSRVRAGDDFEPPCRVATVGIVRACQKNDNGTSNLLLQGLCRVEVLSIAREEPYRRIRVRALASVPGATASENEKLRAELARLIAVKLRLAPGGAKEMSDFLRTVDDPDIFADIAAFSVCENSRIKQRLLETLDVHIRLEQLRHCVTADIDRLKLWRKVQGRLPDDRISHN
ncbi:MAG: LON peptidase substrate-binding domain-containing protein [Opitutaceae bacterium]